MDSSKKCSTSCYWTYRYEILGLVLLFIATALTVVSLNSLGILAMFVVGAVLCCHKYIGCCCHVHHGVCDNEACDTHETKVTPASKKTFTKGK
jgi:hypothetical protein